MDETALIERYIEANPNHTGVDEARLKDFGVSVWALVAYFHGTGNDIQRVANGYAVPSEAVQAALGYYRGHRASIDARIAANAAAVG